MPLVCDHLFSQGTLTSEFDGRIRRLRQEVRDLDAEALAGDDEGVISRLLAKFDLSSVEFEPTPPADDGDAGQLRIPFRGSTVLLHRRPQDGGAADEPIAGRVVEESRRVGDQRVRQSWVEIAAPQCWPGGTTPLTPAQDERQRVVSELAKRIAPGNARLPGFRRDLREAAKEAVRARREKLLKTSELSWRLE